MTITREQAVRKLHGDLLSFMERAGCYTVKDYARVDAMRDAALRGLDAPADAGELVEALADLEHQQWIEWAKSILDKEPISDARYARWIALFRPYAELTEAEKEQDRVWARKAAAALEAARPSEVPCRHEWYQGECVHCKLDADKFRAERLSGSGK